MLQRLIALFRFNTPTSEITSASIAWWDERAARRRGDGE